MSEELDDLRALLHHPGFLLLCQHQARLTGDAMPQIRLALEGSDERALRELRRLVAERDAGERILRWPAQRVRDLEGREDASRSSGMISANVATLTRSEYENR